MFILLSYSWFLTADVHINGSTRLHDTRLVHRTSFLHGICVTVVLFHLFICPFGHVFVFCSTTCYDDMITTSIVGEFCCPYATVEAGAWGSLVNYDLH